MNDNKLTLAQQKMLAAVDYNINVYAFDAKNGYSFSYYSDNTCARVYTTATAKSLIKKGLLQIKMSHPHSDKGIDGALDNCVGILVRRGV